jgi:hypothetical protein
MHKLRCALAIERTRISIAQACTAVHPGGRRAPGSTQRAFASDRATAFGADESLALILDANNAHEEVLAELHSAD